MRNPLDELPPATRRAVLLVRFAGMSPRDAARAQGISTAAIYNALQRARILLSEFRP